MSQNSYLDAIMDCAVNSTANIFINASAGSGKTYTLQRISETVPKFKKAIFLAFNKSIATELRLKLPPHIEVSTIHAKAYSILRSNLQMNVKINDLKNFIYCKNNIKRKFVDRKRENGYMFTVSDAITFLKVNNLKPTEVNFKSLDDSYGICLTKEQKEDVLTVFKAIDKAENNLNKKNPSNIDFTDMLYLCVNKVDANLYPKYDYVMIDESQDFNDTQQIIAMNLLKSNGRLIAVGDVKQAINQFNGSSLRTFEFFRTRPGTKEFSLPITYRCGKKIVDTANVIFPEQTIAKNDAVEGEVYDGSISEAVTGDMVICRNNKPLVSVWVDLVKSGKKASIMGRDFGASLKTILNNAQNLEDLNDLLTNKYLELKENGVKAPHNHPAYQSLSEKIDIIEVLYANFGTLKAVYEQIDKVFSNEKSDITLSTVHKSKGLEADNVFILDWDLIPSKYAFTDEQLYAEKCLQYVAITRAKKKLIFVKSK